MKNILFILGTRPEAIKLAPVILELKKYPDKYKVIICNTEQQKELSNQTLSFFGLKADINLDVMLPNQTLSVVQSRIMKKLGAVFASHKIDSVIVQGDTMSVFCGALVSFYNKVSVFHVEAGLRSYDLHEPFPEEAIRQMVSCITDLHFAPTKASKDALQKENIADKKIFITGNTVIDALLCLKDKVLSPAKEMLSNKGINFEKELVLVTAHRRENHGDRLDNIIKAICSLAKEYADHQFILPVHPNPNVKDKVFKSLNNIDNIILTEPLDYPELVCLIKNAKIILTDSGGIQEEAPTFGVPVLVMRYETERKEGVEAGFAKLVGANYDLILQEARAILDKDKYETRLNAKTNPYGDGKASQKIEAIIDEFLFKK